MPWTLGPVTVANNVVGNARASANCLLCVEDYSQQKTAEQMGITRQQQRLPPSDEQPADLARGVVPGTGESGLCTRRWRHSRSATGQERLGREFIGAPIVDADGRRHHGRDLARRRRGIAVAGRRRRRGRPRRRRAAARLLALRSLSRSATGPRRGQRPADQGVKKIRRIELQLARPCANLPSLRRTGHIGSRAPCVEESEKCGRKIQRRTTGCRVTRKRSRRGRPTSSGLNLGLASSSRPVARTATRAA